MAHSANTMRPRILNMTVSCILTLAINIHYIGLLRALGAPNCFKKYIFHIYTMLLCIHLVFVPSFSQLLNEIATDSLLRTQILHTLGRRNTMPHRNHYRCIQHVAQYVCF
jgi:hypothetical protein